MPDPGQALPRQAAPLGQPGRVSALLPTMQLTLDGTNLTIDQVDAFLRADAASVSVSPAARTAMKRSRELVERIAAGSEAVYGINTGFGRLAMQRIASDRLDELQENLVRSHACGVGEPLGGGVVRLAMLLRINSLCRGHSGIRPEVVDTICALINKGVTPWVPSQGSVGASGDLAPLSHAALVLIGEGRAYFGGELMEAGVALRRAEIEPVQLKAKEGLALINGTQFIQAIGLESICAARRIVKLADVCAALSLEALRGTDRAFDARIHGIRPHRGQGVVAANLRRLLQDSPIRQSHVENDPRVQDQYSLRCVPQVHGASRDTLDHVCRVVETEMNSVTDNPLLFPDEGEVISGGNFHGQPVAMVMDFLAIAMAELASISERRIESMVNPDLSMLPAFLTPDPGLNSGMMMAQVTAAALVSENKTLCHPAVVDSIPTSANKEDHVSMGVWAALKLSRVVKNVRRVLEIELLCARFGVGVLAPLEPGPNLNPVWKALEGTVPSLARDRETWRDMAAVRELIDGGGLDVVLGGLE